MGPCRLEVGVASLVAIAVLGSGCVASEPTSSAAGEPELEGEAAPTSAEARQRVEELAVVIGRELGEHPDQGLHDGERNDRIVAGLRDAGEVPEGAELRYSRTFAQFAYRAPDGTWACAAIRADGEAVDATTGPCPGEIADAD
jgi:hypothetical protein